MNNEKKRLITVVLAISLIVLVLIFIPNFRVNFAKATSEDDNQVELGEEVGENIEEPNEIDGNNNETTEQDNQNNEDVPNNNEDENHVVDEDLNNDETDYYTEVKSELIKKGQSISITNLSNDDAFNMWNTLAEYVLDNHLYNESSEKELYNSMKSDTDYGMVLLNHSYNELIKINYNDRDYKINTIPTNKVQTVIEERNTESNIAEDSVVAEYIKNTYKMVKNKQQDVAGESIDKFRQYNISLGLDVFENPKNTQVGNADIVLLIDNSGSMINNFDDTIKSAKVFINDVLPDGYDDSSDESIKISVVSFSGTVNEIVSSSNNKEEIINGIDSIEKPYSNIDIGENGTNIQKALLVGKGILGIRDTDVNVSDIRKKSLILFTDGGPTTRYTDVWNTSKNITEHSYISSTSGNGYSCGDKRWSNLSNMSWENGTLIPEKVYLPNNSWYLSSDNEIGLSGEYLKQYEFNRDITLLEGQFLSHQGVDIYTVSFTDDMNSKEFLFNLGSPMVNTPNFNSNNVLDSYQLYEQEGFDYSSDNIEEFFNEFIKNSPEIANTIFESYIYEDELNANFEFLSEDFIISSKPFGEDRIENDKWFNVDFDNNKVTWEFPKDFDEGNYFITYSVKVKENANDLYPYGADKELYGNKAEDKESISEKSILKFVKSNGEKFENTFIDEKVSIQPILSISFKSSHENVLAGEVVKLTPEITSGSGFYDFRIYEAGEEKENVLKENEHIKINPSTIYTDEIGIKFANEGKYQYVFEVKDIVSGVVEESQLEITAKEGKLKINILDSKGKDELTGAFETKINAGNSNWDNQKEYYLNGLGEREFKYSSTANFLSKGTSVKVSTYVPYGYEIISIEDSDGKNDGVVNFDLKTDNLGNLVGYEHEITIRVKKIDKPKFFFDWKWIFGSNIFNYKS